MRPPARPFDGGQAGQSAPVLHSGSVAAMVEKGKLNLDLSYILEWDLRIWSVGYITLPLSSAAVVWDAQKRGTPRNVIASVRTKFMTERGN